MLKLTGAALAASVAFAGEACAATFYTDNNGQVIVVSGAITAGDGVKFIDFVLKNQSAVYVRLDSPGGAVNDGIIMAETIRQFKLDTWVSDSDECLSMCALMFAAGVNRWYNPGATIGVHSIRWDPSLVGTKKPPEDEDTMVITMWLARVATDFGMSSQAVGKMVTTPGTGMAYLTDVDLNDWATKIDVTGKKYVERAETAEGFHRMDCKSSETGGTYVAWVGGGNMQVGSHFYTIAEQYYSDNAGAYVVDGKTHIKTDYSAVFGGNDPSIRYWDGKTNVIDHCHIT